MKYEKPMLEVSARAVEAILGQTKNHGSTIDSQSDPRVHTVPAYEADE